MQPFYDATPLLGDAEALRARMQLDGYLFIRNLLPRDAIARVQRQVGERAREAGWLQPDAPVEEARANLARTDAEEAAERTRIRTELYVLYLELNHYLEVAAALRNNIIPLNETALAETQTAYEQGRYNYQELSTAQDALLAARNDLVSQSIEAHRRMIEIERFTGLTIEANQ
jgi:hypothetical protein